MALSTTAQNAVQKFAAGDRSPETMRALELNLIELVGMTTADLDKALRELEAQQRADRQAAVRARMESNAAKANGVAAKPAAFVAPKTASLAGTGIVTKTGPEAKFVLGVNASGEVTYRSASSGREYSVEAINARVLRQNAVAAAMRDYEAKHGVAMSRQQVAQLNKVSRLAADRVNSAKATDPRLQAKLDGLSITELAAVNENALITMKGDFAEAGIGSDVDISRAVSSLVNVAEDMGREQQRSTSYGLEMNLQQNQTTSRPGEGYGLAG